jgi:hypothetical protein
MVVGQTMDRVPALRAGCDGSVVEIIVSLTVIESSLRCSIKVARLLISDVVARAACDQVVVRQNAKRHVFWPRDAVIANGAACQFESAQNRMKHRSDVVS